METMHKKVALMHKMGRSLFDIWKETKLSPDRIYDAIKDEGLRYKVGEGPYIPNKYGSYIDRLGTKCCLPPPVVIGSATGSSTTVEYRRKEGVVPRTWKGIFYDRHHKKYVAQMKVNKKRTIVGRYDTHEEAVKAQIIAMYGESNWPKQYR